MALRFTAVFLLLVCINQVCKAVQTLNEVQSFSTAANIADVLYSSQYNLLLLRDSTSDVRVLNATTGAQLSLRNSSATGTFTDFALSPSGRYLYVAEYGGTNIGYNTPINPSFVNRYDLQLGTWSSAQAPSIAYRIATVDDNRVFLLSRRWV
jgi:hypothetical protein